MHSKRTIIRVINRILYAGGFVFLIVGLLLSALSASVSAAGPSSEAAQGAAQAPTQITPPNCYCATSTPTARGPSATPKTPKPTRPPMLINLSNICGYTFDTYSLWKVANPGTVDVNYRWQVVGSSEAGSGTVRAGSDDYFTTTAGITLRLYVGDQLIDTESCLAPCKTEISLAYVCTDQGQVWRATNVNSFGVDYTVTIDGAPAGSGVIPPNSTVNVATTTTGGHTVRLTWTDTRPGTHTVTLTSPPESCSRPVTATPTFTVTAPPVIITPTDTPTTTATFTPTFTSTPPQDATATFTPTPTATNTAPPAVITPTDTPTLTETPTQDVTATFTLTPTLTIPPPQGSTATFTPTPTATATVTSTSTSTSTATATFTNTPTATSTATVTSTPTITLTPNPGVVPSTTFTPTITLTPGPTFTSTFTPTATQTPLAGLIPSATVTSTATQILTLAPPASTVTSTPVLIPVTGVDLTLPIAANSLSLFGGLITNIGLFTLGLALALTGISSQLKD